MVREGPGRERGQGEGRERGACVHVCVLCVRVSGVCVYMRVYMCECVSEKERERERERGTEKKRGDVDGAGASHGPRGDK